jgi:hypothetical protein
MSQKRDPFGKLRVGDGAHVFVAMVRPGPPALPVPASGSFCFAALRSGCRQNLPTGFRCDAYHAPARPEGLSLVSMVILATLLCSLIVPLVALGVMLFVERHNES